MKKIIKQWAAPVLCGLFILLLFRFAFFIGYVPSTSMEPTIKAGSVIFGHRFISNINRGDVLVFSHDRYMVVKRVAAVERDLIYIDQTGTVISVNDKLSGAVKIMRVPDGCFFMLGDNINDSIDSRAWDNPYITRKQVIAKLW